MSATLTLHKCTAPDVRYTDVNDTRYFVTKIDTTRFVSTAMEPIGAADSIKGAKELINAHAGTSLPTETTKANVVIVDGPSASEVRTWAKATGRPVGDRGRLSPELYAEYARKPAGAWRTPQGHFVRK